MINSESSLYKIISNKPVHSSVLVVAWLIIIVFPLFYFRYSLNEIVTSLENSRKNQIDERILREMENFESDLQLRIQIQNAISQALRECKLVPESSIHRFTVQRGIDPNIFNDVSLKKFVKSLQRQLGVKPLIAIFSGCDLKSTFIFTNSKFLPASRKPSLRMAEMIMAGISNIESRNSLIYSDYLNNLKQRVGTQIFKRQVEFFFNQIFGEKVHPKIPHGEVFEAYSSVIGEGRIFVFQQFVPQGISKNAPILGGLLIAYHSRMFSIPGIIRRAVKNGSESVFKRSVVVESLRDFPDLPKITSTKKGKSYKKIIASSIAAVNYLHGKSFYDYFAAPNFYSGNIGIISLKLDVPEAFIKHPWRNNLTVANTLIALIISISGILLLRIVFFKKELSFKIRWKAFLSLFVSVSIPLAGFWVGMTYFQKAQEINENRRLLSKLAEELRLFEIGIKSFESYVHLDLWQLRRELEQNLDQSPDKIVDILNKWSKKDLYAGFYFLHRDGWEYRSSLFLGDSDNTKKIDELSLSRDVINAYRSLATIGLLLAQKKLKEISVLPAYVDSFVSRLEKGKTPDKFFRSYLKAMYNRKEILKITHTVLIYNGQLFKSFFLAHGKFKQCPMILSSGNSDEQFGKAILIVVLPFEKIAESYFSLLNTTLRNFRKTEGYFNIRQTIFKTDYNKTTLKVIPAFTQPDDDLKELAQDVLKIGKDISWDESDRAKPRLVSARIFQDFPYIAVAIATPDYRYKGSFRRSMFVLSLTFYSLFMIWIISYVLSQIFIDPLELIKKSVTRIQNGYFRTKLLIETNDEFGELAIAFNQMSKALLEREHISRFIPTQVLEVIKDNSETALTPGGKRLHLAVLVSDIRGFTSITERNTPQEVVSMLNEYFSKMEPAILRFNGVIDKFIGDAIFAVFYPQSNTEAPEIRACKAAIEMRRQLAILNQERAYAGKFIIENGIGIACGEAISGKIGSFSGRLVYTVVGDIVQEANELESLSKNGKFSKIMVSTRVGSVVSRSFDLYGHILPILDNKDQFSFFEIINERNG